MFLYIWIAIMVLFFIILMGCAFWEITNRESILKYIRNRYNTKRIYKIAKKQEYAKKKSEKIYKKNIKKLYKKSDNYKVLKIQFEYYVAILENILKETCAEKRYRLNEMYLIKLFDYYLYQKFEIYSVEGLFYLFQSIKECPIIEVKNKETYNKNVEILEKLISYKFSKESFKYKNKYIENNEISNILVDLIKNNLCK